MIIPQNYQFMIKFNDKNIWLMVEAYSTARGWVQGFPWKDSLASLFEYVKHAISCLITSSVWTTDLFIVKSLKMRNRWSICRNYYEAVTKVVTGYLITKKNVAECPVFRSPL